MKTRVCRKCWTNDVCCRQIWQEQSRYPGLRRTQPLNPKVTAVRQWSVILLFLGIILWDCAEIFQINTIIVQWTPGILSSGLMDRYLIFHPIKRSVKTCGLYCSLRAEAVIWHWSNWVKLYQQKPSITLPVHHTLLLSFERNSGHNQVLGFKKRRHRLCWK